MPKYELDPAELVDTENRRIHVQINQSIIQRFGFKGFIIKTWSIALLIAALFIDDQAIYLHTLVLAVCLWFLDGYMLWQERLSRELHNRIREHTANDYDLDSTLCVGGNRTWWKATMSHTLFLFHFPIAAVTARQMVPWSVF